MLIGEISLWKNPSLTRRVLLPAGGLARTTCLSHPFIFASGKTSCIWSFLPCVKEEILINCHSGTKNSICLEFPE